MINRKFLLIICILAFAGKPTPMLGMDAALPHEQPAQTIRNLRDRINEKREFFSRTCWKASTMWAITSGLITGWLCYKHSECLPRLFQFFSTRHRATVAAVGTTALNLGASWLTKHWGIYYFLTHRGEIKQLKDALKHISDQEKTERVIARDSLNNARTIGELEETNNHLQQEIQSAASTHQQELQNATAQELRVREATQQQLLQVQQTTNALRQAMTAHITALVPPRV